MRRCCSPADQLLGEETKTSGDLSTIRAQTEARRHPAITSAMHTAAIAGMHSPVLAKVTVALLAPTLTTLMHLGQVKSIQRDFSFDSKFNLRFYITPNAVVSRSSNRLTDSYFAFN